MGPQFVALSVHFLSCGILLAFGLVELSEEGGLLVDCVVFDVIHLPLVLLLHHLQLLLDGLQFELVLLVRLVELLLLSLKEKAELLLLGLELHHSFLLE